MTKDFFKKLSLSTQNITNASDTPNGSLQKGDKYSQIEDSAKSFPKDDICSDDVEKDYYDNTPYDNYDDGNDWEEEAWYAMTDGMYGDMPENFDGDYDFLGF